MQLNEQVSSLVKRADEQVDDYLASEHFLLADEGKEKLKRKEKRKKKKGEPSERTDRESGKEKERNRSSKKKKNRDRSRREEDFEAVAPQGPPGLVQ